VNIFDRLTRDISDFLPLLPGMVLTFLVGAVLIRLLVWLFGEAIKFSKLPPGLRGILKTILSILLWISLFVVIFLTTPGLSQFAIFLSGTSALLLFVISAGAASLIADVIAGIMLSGDRHFRIGWRIKLGDKETEGEIISMDIRKTRLEDAEGRIHVVPNSLVEKNEWIVLEEGGSKPRPAKDS
jgi:small-conductance mechanosensitive channel